MRGKYEALILKDVVQVLVKETRTWKANGLDGRAAECLESGGVTLTDWLIRLLNVL